MQATAHRAGNENHLGVSVRRLCLVAAVVTFSVSAAEAKPLVVVQTDFGKGAAALKKRIALDLQDDHIKLTPEDFITEQFIASMATLRMFDFKPITAGTSQWRLTITIDSMSSTQWPLGDVQLTLAIDGQVFQVPFCMRAACYGECIPPSFSNTSWYRSKFDAVLQQWPPGFLKTIPLSQSARYEKGHIVVQANLADFGQPPNGPPTAFFELINGSIQRQFVFCRSRNGQAEGDDHGKQAQANCSAGPVQPPLNLPGAGTITLLRGRL